MPGYNRSTFEIVAAILTAYRYSKLCRQLYHPMLELGGVSKNPENFIEQVESRPCFCTQARMASQLANLHQRNHILLPYKLIDMREQHVNFALIIRRSVRLFRRLNDIDQDKDAEDDNVLGIYCDLPALQRGAK
jgi:hypothetical protein